MPSRTVPRFEEWNFMDTEKHGEIEVGNCDEGGNFHEDGHNFTRQFHGILVPAACPIGIIIIIYYSARPLGHAVRLPVFSAPFAFRPIAVFH
jgi:hypothetical protein